MRSLVGRFMPAKREKKEKEKLQMLYHNAAISQIPSNTREMSTAITLARKVRNMTKGKLKKYVLT